MTKPKNTYVRKRPRITPCKKVKGSLSLNHSGSNPGIRPYEYPISKSFLSCGISRKEQVKYFAMYPCGLCQITFVNARDFKEHIIQVHRCKKNENVNSSHSVSSGKERSAHDENSAASGKMIQTTMEMIEKNLNVIEEEIKRYSDSQALQITNVTYACPLCGASFSDVSSRRRHVRIHLSKYPCGLCHVSFPNMKEYSEHIILLHRSRCEDDSLDRSPLKLKMTQRKQNEIVSRISNVPEVVLHNGDKDTPMDNVDKLPAQNFISEYSVAAHKGKRKTNHGKIVKRVSGSYPNDKLGNSDALDKEDALPMNMDTDQIFGNLVSECDAAIQKLIIKNFDATSTPDLDFGNELHINWLLKFVEESKVLKFPLSTVILKKIIHVHKSLYDSLLSSTELNFNVLSNIHKELSQIVNDHLFHCKIKM